VKPLIGVVIVGSLLSVAPVVGPSLAGEQSTARPGSVKTSVHGFGTHAHRAGFGESERGPNRHHRSHHHAKAARKLCANC
jgi:hypothetical protein